MTTFLRIVETLLADPAEKAAFNADPDVYLHDQGFGSFDGNDVEQALVHTLDVLPPAVAETLDPSAGLESVVAVDLAETDQLDIAEPLDAFGIDPGFDVGDGDAVDALDSSELDVENDQVEREGDDQVGEHVESGAVDLEDPIESVEGTTDAAGEPEIADSLTDLEFDLATDGLDDVSDIDTAEAVDGWETGPEEADVDSLDDLFDA